MRQTAFLPGRWWTPCPWSTTAPPCPRPRLARPSGGPPSRRGGRPRTGGRTGGRGSTSRRRRGGGGGSGAWRRSRSSRLKREEKRKNYVKKAFFRKRNIMFFFLKNIKIFVKKFAIFFSKNLNLKQWKVLNFRMNQYNIAKMCASPTGNRTPVSRVTGGDTYHYTIEDGLWGEENFSCLKDSPETLPFPCVLHSETPPQRRRRKIAEREEPIFRFPERRSIFW